MNERNMFTLPEPHVLNEVWGAMPLSQYNELIANPPALWRWVLFYFCVMDHPYVRFANR